MGLLPKKDKSKAAAVESPQPSAAPPSGAAGAADTSSPPFDINASDVDSATCTIAPPPHYPIICSDYVVKCGPHKLFKTMMDESSEIATRCAAAQKQMDPVFKPWGADPDGKAVAWRDYNYRQKSPLGDVKVVEYHSVLTKNDGGFVISQKVCPAIPPMGHGCDILMLTTGRLIAPGKTHLTTSMSVSWFKTGMVVKMLKAQVDTDCAKDNKAYWDGLLRNELQQAYGVEAPPAGSAPVTAAPAAGAAASSAATGAAAAGGAAPAAAAAGLEVGGVPVQLLVLGVGLLLITWALMGLSGQVGRTSRALEEITAAAVALREQLAKM